MKAWERIKYAGRLITGLPVLILTLWALVVGWIVEWIEEHIFRHSIHYHPMPTVITMFKGGFVSVVLSMLGLAAWIIWKSRR